VFSFNSRLKAYKELKLVCWVKNSYMVGAVVVSETKWLWKWAYKKCFLKG